MSYGVDSLEKKNILSVLLKMLYFKQVDFIEHISISKSVNGQSLRM